MTLKDSSAATLGRLLIVMVGMLVMASCSGGSSSSSSTTTTPASNNSVTLSVGAGPTGTYINGIFTNVTICQPGSTTNCQTVDNVLVDTGSIGLRILDSALTLPTSSLGAIADSNGDELQECIQYGDTSYSWGSVWAADVSIAGEKASSVPIHVFGGSTYTTPSQCIATPINPNLPNGGDENTLATFGANGLLGVGTAPYDCGSYCTDSSELTVAGYPYYVCPSGACSTVNTSTQVENPVAFFSSSDNNGVMITLGSVEANGAASVSGTMNFGIGTQTDNGLGSATLYALDDTGSIPTVSYGNFSYTYYNVVDTGSEALDISDAGTLSSLGISDCAQGTAGSGFYCVSGGGTATLSGIGIAGYNSVGSGTVSLSITDATTLLNANPNNWVFNNVGSDGGTTPSTDLFDFGLPFFLGKTVYVGIAGATVPNSASAPNGFVAF